MNGKAVVALGGGLSLVALLAGCGSSPSTSASSSGPVNITYSTFVVQRYNLLQKQVNKFNAAHKNTIHVTLEHEPGTNTMLTKLLTGLSSGTAPNLVEQYGAYTEQLVGSGGIVPLKSFMKQSHYSLKGFYADEIQKATVKGKLWGLSIDGGPENQELYYNKTLFEKYHVPFPSNNWTWAQLLSDAKALNHPAQKNYGYLTFIGTTEGVSTRFYPYLWNAGGQIMNSSNTKATFDSAAGVKALNFMMQLQKYSDVVARSEYEAPFQSGHVAMSVTGGWNIGTFYQAHLNFGIASMPSMTPGGSHWTPAGPDFNLITKSTPAKEHAAWVFLEYLESPEMAAVMTANGNAPFREITPQKYPAYAATLKQYPAVGWEVALAKWDRLTPSFSNYSKVSLDIATATEEAFLHKMSPAQALKSYATQANQMLSGSNP